MIVLRKMLRNMGNVCMDSAVVLSLSRHFKEWIIVDCKGYVECILNAFNTCMYVCMLYIYMWTMFVRI